MGIEHQEEFEKIRGASSFPQGEPCGRGRGLKVNTKKEQSNHREGKNSKKK